MPVTVTIAIASLDWSDDDQLQPDEHESDEQGEPG